MFLISCRLRIPTGLLAGVAPVLAILGGTILGLAGRAEIVQAKPLSSEWIEKWTEDLRSAQRSVEERHPNAFHALSREEWNVEFDTLIERLGELQHHEVTVELTRIVARLQDGHTRLTLPLGPGIDFMQGHSQTPPPHLPELQIHQYPLRFAIDEHGVYVQRIAVQHRAALGARVVTLGRMPIEAALEAMTPTIRRDNELQVRHHLPSHLVLAELLHARGVTETRHELRVEMESPDGESIRVDLRPVPHGQTVEWADARDAANAPLPLYLQHPERKFWFSHLAERRTVYLQFNEVYNEEDETLRDFATRVGEFVGDHGVENLIVDLRNNRGGNMRLARPLLHAIQCSRVNQTGHLFALIGRTTFSAAMNFVLTLEKHTRVLFVGEPTGSSPNHYGDSRKIRLPHTGLTLRVSTLYHQYDPTDRRASVAPHIPVDLTAADYRSNRDPGFATILDLIDARATRDAGGATPAQTAGVASAASEAGAEGAWRGWTSPGLNLFELNLDIQGPVSAPQIQLQMPALELNTAATDVGWVGQVLRFQTRWREETIVFTGTNAGDWFIGKGDFRSVYFPFVLRRQAAGKAGRALR